MDRLRQLISRINNQLSVLTVSQRIAIGLCAALVATSLLWLLQWSTTPEMVALLPYKFSLDEQTAAESALRAGGHDYKIYNNRIYVRPDDQPNLVRVLHSAGALPEGSLYTMEDMVADTNPFMAPEERRFRQNVAKGNSLALIIKTSPFVKSAAVVINDQTKRRLGGKSDVPTASVSVELSLGRDMTGELVDGFAKLVSGAVLGLKPHNVFVTDSRTGRTMSPPHPDEALGLGYLEEVKKREAHLVGKILGLLAYIPGVRAEVSVELDGNKKLSTRVTHNKPAIKKEDSRTSETSSGVAPGETGLQPNVGVGLASGGTGQSSVTEESTSEFHPPAVAKTEQIESMPFAPKGVRATVSIPRSFIVGLYKAEHPETENPTDQDLIQDQTELVTKVKSSVQRIVMAESEADVYVDVYPDINWSPSGGSWNSTPTGVAVGEKGMGAADTMALVKGYGPQVGLGMLALMSLFMMTRIVRKASDAVPKVPVESDDDEHEGVLSVGPHAVGEAEVGDSFLTAREVDEDTLMNQQLSKEVSRMVEEDPAAAADLLRRWIDDSE